MFTEVLTRLCISPSGDVAETVQVWVIIIETDRSDASTVVERCGEVEQGDIVIQAVR